ncbi:alginate O-acetyltransferase complex protein AlgI [Verrucomicrobium sp. GAS474]|uniref:MBOAT family O-acyltransferase n=1 Tax=Verrucomicrobium sp. GAS474 TaxID=1882831 RepID=UPI00087DC799|nr:MBOAT family O-acyltransferase [Verrucomicrobium sp. GAS474]SDT87477.1 alginate O-acetyltransferase complex protein AlgI [Verrucomicrobium sp. GAS474]
MLFTSLSFFWLLTATLFLYYVVARTAALQIGVLVAASLVFYAWENPLLLILLAFCTGVAAGVSRAVAVDAAGGGRHRAGWLVFGGVAVLLAMLAYFKYSKLFYWTFHAEAARVYHAFHGEGAGWAWRQFLLGMPLPIGISFYIFHGISLIVDTWRGDWKPPAREGGLSAFGRTTLYMVFFPQLIAGPITKARDFFPQIQTPASGVKRWKEIDFIAVARLLIAGYFFKRVVADNLATETMWMGAGSYEGLPGFHLLLLLFGFSAQIFADFYGYSLIALGLGRLFGFRLPVNFDRPYLAASFSEFWRRWHMSLSAWLRDYLFIPLGGSRHGLARTAVNLMIVMFLGGLWHGAAWGFAFWGLFHGAALALERPFLRKEGESSGVERAVRIAIVFSLVTFGWLFFKFPNLGQAFAYLHAIGANWPKKILLQQCAPVLLCLIPVFLHHASPFLFPKGFSARLEAWTLAAMLFLLLVNSGVPGAFIYFQF